MKSACLLADVSLVYRALASWITTGHANMQSCSVCLPCNSGQFTVK